MTRPIHMLNVLKVFTAPDGSGGNALGVFLDGPAISEDRRQAIAADLDFSETVFLDDPDTGRLQIYTPVRQVSLAGHPLVGTSWLLTHENKSVDTLRPPAGDVTTWSEDGLTWIRGRAEWAVEFTFLRLDSPREVAALTAAPNGLGDAYCWAWEDDAAGILRARNFVPSNNIREDQATGSAAMVLAARLGRPLVIHQGDGSVLRACPGRDRTSEVGGQVVLVETRGYEAPTLST